MALLLKASILLALTSPLTFHDQPDTAQNCKGCSILAPRKIECLTPQDVQELLAIKELQKSLYYGRHRHISPKERRAILSRITTCKNKADLEAERRATLEKEERRKEWGRSNKNLCVSQELTSARQPRSEKRPYDRQGKNRINQPRR